MHQHCTNCYTCQLHKTAAVKFEAKHFKPSMRPMDFIAMDLIGEFHPPSSNGNRYALTRVCMLTGFTWCILIKSKKASDVARAYLQHVYVMQLRSGEDPELWNTLENASYRGGRAANDLTIPQPKVMAAYSLYSPATAKQIKDEMRQTHTYCNKRPLDHMGSLLPCEPKCQCSWSAADCISLKCPQPQILQDLP